MERIQEFEGLLNDLSKYSDDANKAGVVLARISQFFMSEETHSSADLLVFLALGESGILSFIKGIASQERNKYNVLIAFDLLEFLLINFDKFCIPYVEDVKRLCLYLVQCDSAAKIKENSLKLLKCLFSPTFIAAVDVAGVLSTVKSCLRVRSAVPPSVQEQLLSVVGIIFERVPECSEQAKQWFLNLLVDKMKESSKSPSVLAGCFDGLHGYMAHFELPDAETLGFIYSCIKTHSKLQESQVRRGAGRSALKVIRDRYLVFSKYIHEDIRYWDEVLNKWLKKTGEDKQLGFSGLVSCYRSVAREISKSDPQYSSYELEELVRWLLTKGDLPSTIGVIELVSTGHVTENLTNRSLQVVMERSRTAEKDDHVFLPINVECLSKYLSKESAGQDRELIRMRTLAVSLIDKYPGMSSHLQKHSLRAIEVSFYNLARRGRVDLDEYARDVAYHGLIRSCSHGLSADAELHRQITGRDMVTHRSFLPVWVHLTNLSCSNIESEMSEWKSSISIKIFDQYLSAFARINRKLDLRIQAVNTNATDFEKSYEAVRPDDFRVFINNVNTFVDVLTELSDLHMLKKWMTGLLTEMIDSSYKAPLVSGFYKVVAALFHAAEKLNFFGESHRETEEMLKRFMRDVSVRVRLYKGDLQISCLQVLLSAPVSFVESFTAELVPIFKVILRASSGYLPLLKDSIDALERWYRDLPKESIEYILRSILPYFDLFLQSKAAVRGGDDEGRISLTTLKTRGKVRRIDRKDSDSQLLLLQRKFLYLLGKLNQNVCKQLIRPVDDSEEAEEVNDENMERNRLTYEIPLGDAKLRLRLDEWLPRVVDLSLSSSDRHTRTTACEFLHSVVLLTLGSMKQMNGELNGLFRKLVSACLALGCDSDHVVLQIHEPLVRQMVHYFSNGGDFSARELFIGCLMDAVSHPFNSSLRDFASELIRELTEWSIRDLSAAEASGGPNNVTAILRSMYSLAVHADHAKRCGAATVFNNIYSLIREEDTLINAHWFMLYYYFMECLNMCTAYDDTTHIIKAIEHIRGPLSERDFNRGSKSRKIPPGFRGNTLDCLLEWTFKRCRHVQTKLRHLSMRLVEELVRNLGKPSSVKEFAARHMMDDIHMERRYLKSNPDEESYLDWLRYNWAFFDYYNFLLLENVLAEVDVARIDLNSMMVLFADGMTSLPDGLHTDMLASAKSSAVVQMLRLLLTCFARGICGCDEKILHLIRTCLWTPSSLKFDLCHRDNCENLRIILMELIPVLVDNISEDKVNSLFDLTNFTSDLERLGHCLRSGTPLTGALEPVNGLKILRSLKLWDSTLSCRIRGDDIAKMIFHSLFTDRHRHEYCVTVEAHDRRVLRESVGFSMSIGLSLGTLMDMITHQEEVINEETFEKVTKGEYFLELFKDEIFRYFIADPGSSLNLILYRLKPKALDITHDIVRHADGMELTFEEKQRLVSNVYGRWPELEELSEKTGKRTLLMSILKVACRLHSDSLAENDSMRREIIRYMGCAYMSSTDVMLILDILPYLPVADEETNIHLVDGLNKLFENQKLFTEEVPNTDPKIKATYEALLAGFGLTRSLPVLKHLLKILTHYASVLDGGDAVRIAEDVCGDAENGPQRGNHIRKILLLLYEEIFILEPYNETPVPCLLAALRSCRSELARTFLSERLVDLVGLVKNAGSLALRISALKVIQKSVTRMTREDLDDLPTEMRGAFQDLVRICSENPDRSKARTAEESEVQRQYACARFNTLCTFITAKTDNSLQYRRLIFKNDFSLLAGLVPRDRRYALSMDFDELPKRRKVMTNLRRSITREKNARLGASVGSVKYVSDQSLFASSLSEDTAKFDFSTTVSGPVGESSRWKSSEKHVELEMDAINDHECMPTLVGIVDHMVDAGITPIAEGGEEPFWLQATMNHLRSYDSTENEKIFLFKLIINLEKYVKPYASKVVPDLLDKLVEVFQEKPINYLLMDLVTVILSWRPETVRSAVELSLTRLILYIIDKSISFRKDIIKSNLDVAKLIVETCKNRLDLRKLSLRAFEMLKEKSGSYAVNYVTLHFCGILLSNGVPAWNEGDEDELFALLLRRCRSDAKNGKLAAEICGLSLKYLENSQHLDRYASKVRDDLRQHLTSSEGDDVSILHAVHKHFPRIVSQFIGTIQLRAWKIRGPSRDMCLEMLNAHLRGLPKGDILESTMGNFLKDMLSEKDLVVVDLTLQIVNQILDEISRRDDMDQVLEAALSFGDCKMKNVRDRVYELAVRLSEKSELNPGILHQCKVVLLKGMNDADADLSEKCLRFWYEKTRRSSSPVQFSDALNELYSPEVESEFLNFAARLMIRSASDAADYRKSIFEHPLRQGGGSLRSRNIFKTIRCTAMAPMFAPTLASQLNQPETLIRLSSTLSQGKFELPNPTSEASGSQSPDGGRKAARRFVRNPTTAHFAQKKKKKKSSSTGVKTEQTTAPDEELDILREYLDGDYPDIQITHFDVLKPLEVLTRKDPQIGRGFLVSLYDGFAEGIDDSDSSEMYAKMGKLIQTVMQESTESDPTVIAFLFHVLLKCHGRLEVNAEAVARFAKSSGWLSVGGLIIEDMIIRGECDDSFRGKMKVTPEEMKWLTLAELCRSSRELQTLRGILTDKLRVVGDAGEAIRCESIGDWRRASELYHSVLTSPSRMPSDFYVDAYFFSLARLSDWSTVNASIRDSYDLDDLWSLPDRADIVLPWFVKSEMMNTLRSGDGSMSEFIRDVRQDEEKERKVKRFFLAEMAVAHFTEGTLNWSNYYLKQVYFNFLSNWSHWNKWSNNLREARLMELPLISELHQSLSVLGEKTASETEEEVNGLVLLWKRNQPRVDEDLMYWDVKLTCRDRFLTALKSSCTYLDTADIVNSAVSAEFAMVKSAIAQRNVQLSEEYLTRIGKKLRNSDDGELRLMHSLYSSSLEMLRADKGGIAGDEGIKKLTDMSSHLRDQMYKVMDTGRDGHRLFFFECNVTLSSVMDLLGSVVHKTSDVGLHRVATYLYQPNTSTRDNLLSILRAKELEHLEEAKNALGGADAREEVTLSDVYLRMAKYYRKYKSYDSELAKCLFQAMKLGNPEARLVFCCLLSEPQLVRDWLRDDTLKKLCGTVPVWMFLTWTNQLLANLDSEMFPFVKDLLLPLSEEYPNAIRYSFALSRENYKFDTRHGSQVRVFADELSRKLLSNPSHNEFLEALSFVASPDLILKHYLSKVIDRIDSNTDWESVDEDVRRIRERMFGAEYKRFRGNIFDGLAEFEPQLSCLSKMNREPALWTSHVGAMLRALSKVNLRHNILRSYSPWLHNFQAMSGDEKIEVPGQYDVDQRPILKYHAAISSFRYNVLVMNSKCRPIRVSILGDDAREYKFLVKFGEDLRQDQRIQQVFRHMNHLLSAGQKSGGSSIDTYKVAPVRSNMGLIEWVGNTSSLHELLIKSNLKVEERMEKVQQEHLEFLAQDPGVTSPITAHLNGYMFVDRDRAIARFNRCVNEFEWDLLRNAFWRLSGSPEEFAYLRRNFAVSYATICIAHWIVGIGDRHLDNILISRKTGRALGIDFGCAFGFATETLTPPELVPFRLTPQILNLMKPMEESGLMRETMVNCLATFRREEFVLSATLEVFASEPALNWLERAGRGGGSRKLGETGSERGTWSPHRKMDMVREKLIGVNPVKIFRDDLVYGHTRSQYLIKYLDVLEGGAHCSRETSLTAEKQVECLIGLSSDRHILSKTYVGWNPWL